MRIAAAQGVKLIEQSWERMGVEAESWPSVVATIIEEDACGGNGELEWIPLVRLISADGNGTRRPRHGTFSKVPPE